MRFPKNFTVSCILLSINTLLSQENTIIADKIPSNSIEQQVPITPQTIDKTDTTSTNDQNKDISNKPIDELQASQETATSEKTKNETKPSPENKTELSDWQDHLKKLLIKGAFWDTTTNTPTLDWQNNSFELAHKIIDKNSLLADELKFSFLTTLNDKFLTIEKGTNLTSIATLINEFNQKIDTFVKEKLPQEIVPAPIVEPQTESNKEEKRTTPTQQESEAKSEEIESNKSTVTLEPSELTSPDDIKAEKKEKKLKSSWQEIIDNIKNEGITQEEVDQIIDQVKDVIQQIVDKSSSLEEIDELKKEFLDAVSIRQGKALIQLSQSAIDDIMKIFKAEETQTSFMPSTIDFNNKVPSAIKDDTKQREKENREKTIKKDKYQDDAAKVPEEKNSSVTTFITNSTVPITSFTPETEATNFQNIALVNAQKKQLEHALSLKIKIAAQKKINDEKATEKKGIISSIMNIFFASQPTQETIAKNELIKTQDNDIDLMLTQKINPQNGKLLTQDEKDLIKSALVLFQNVLLEFSSTKYWDIKEEKPNQKWIKDLKHPLKLLLKYEFMTEDIALKVLDETFKINSKVSHVNAVEIKKEISTMINTINASLEKEKIEQQKRKEQQRQKKLEEEQRARMQKEREEQEKTLMMQEEKKARKENKKTHRERFAFLETEKENLIDAWKNLMNRIAMSELPTIEGNRLLTREAIELTTKLIQTLTSLGQDTQKKLINQHKSDFSKAFLAQDEKNQGTVNIYLSIDAFNSSIHQLE